MSKHTVSFVTDDNKRSLFPLKSTARYIELGSDQLRNLIYNNIFDNSNKNDSFSTCPIVYALKDNIHLRKMLFLDPAASFYIYDFLIRNSEKFQINTKKQKRKYYGYALKGKESLSPFTQYHTFRKRKYELKSEYSYFSKVDISNCFNSFYHHDVVSHLRAHVPENESIQFGQFLREINAGASINCFPQGIYPAKSIGNNYLSFCENSYDLNSSSIIRFLDDIFLFDDNISVIEKDIIVLQQIIGARGLALNEGKTKIGSRDSDFEEKQLDNIKKSLLAKREEVFSYDESAETNIILDFEEVEYLQNIIKSKDVSEEDVELALSLFKQDEDEVGVLIDIVFNRYPHLIKDLHRHMLDIEDNGLLWTAIKNKVNKNFLTEYELFWLVRTIIDIYRFDENSAELLFKIFKHQCSSPIVKSAILEFTDNRFGLEDLKLQQLRSGGEGIIASSAVAGLEKLEKSKRNQQFKYISKSSQYLQTLCSIMSKT